MFTYETQNSKSLLQEASQSEPQFYLTACMEGGTACPGSWELGTHGLGEELVCGYSSIRNILNDKWQVLRSSKHCLYRKIGRNHVGKWGASAHLMQLQQPALWLLKVFCAGFSDQFGKFLSATFIVCSFVYKQLQFVRYCAVSWVVCKMNY